MKFVSLFGRTPSHKKFTYEPRFYNEQEEKQKEREDRIRQEIARERGEALPEETSDYRSRIRGSFQGSRKRSKRTPGDFKAAILRSGILLAMVLFVIAYLNWGNDALYGLFVLVPAYFYFKFKK